jgi:prepilin-type N-terminal cleavage/methylation domain-containing protein
MVVSRAARRAKTSPGRFAFTLVELLVVIGVIGLLMSILLPTLGRAREQANRLKCASNLREIGRAALLYANDNRGQFPRTYYQPGVGLLNSTKGGLGNEPAANPFDSASPASPVGASNVAASAYLLVRNGYVPAGTFTCPSNRMAEPFPISDVDRYSNFPSPMRKYNSYSFAAMFPNNRAVNDGWRLTTTSNPEWPLAADLNPGKGGKNFHTEEVQDVTSVRYTDDKRSLARGNSNNHANEGQQIVYVDGHVEWHTSPFAGPVRPGRPWRDNVYANTNGVDANTGLGGGVHAQPNDRYDAVLHPADGAK